MNDSGSHGVQEGADVSLEYAAQNRVIQDSTRVLGDGRVDINLDSKISQAFVRFLSIDEPDIPPSKHERPESWSLQLNILIMVVGSRGDVQPFVALGNGLQKYGHRVRIATHAVFEDFVQSAGLEFFPIGGDPAQLMAYMVKNPGLVPGLKSMGEVREKRHMVGEMMRGCWAACYEAGTNDIPFVANAIIANPPTFAHVHCAQALGIPLHMVFTMPWSPTTAFSHPLANIRNTTTDERIANRLSFGLVNILTWQGLGDVINNFRTDILGLEPIPLTEGPFLLETLQIPYSYCWSPGLIPKPQDWPDRLDVTGFIFRSPPEYHPPAELNNFLKAGPPPLYVGFGSIVVDDPSLLLRTILTAVEMTNVRCIIGKGWSTLDAEDVPEDVIFVGECPHEWLFERTFAVVHHGGAGTVAAGLNAGKPTVVVPFFGDQSFWGDMIARAGAGPLPLPHGNLNAQDLAAAIEFCRTPEATAAAKQMAKRIQSENGVDTTIKSFHRNLCPDLLRCEIIPTLPAIFECKTGRKLKAGGLVRRKVKLSGLAAETLERANKIKLKSLRAYKPKPITIENRRWDMFTSLTSTTVGISYDLLSTTNDIWYAPYKLSKHEEASSGACADTDLESTVTITKSKGDFAKSAGKYAGASAVQFPKLLGVLTKGVVLDIPAAVTEGLRATPRLHGEAVKDHDAITDWKSGLKVAGKELITGTGKGLTDLVAQPYTGAKEKGVGGFMTGIAKGAVGTVTKTSSAVLGLYAHTGQGIYRSIYAASHSNARKNIMSAHRAAHSIHTAEDVRSSDAAIIAAWDMLHDERDST